MTELDKAIQQAKNEKQKCINEVNEMITNTKIREAERRMIDSFIDILNDLKKKTE